MVNLEWESKTKEILYEIQQNDLMLEKKEFERNSQMDELYNMIAQQEAKIETLTKQLQHQARKEQAALAHSKLNLSKSMVGANSFVGISGGQSFVVQHKEKPLVSPSKGKAKRNNSSDRLKEEDSESKDIPVTSPEKIGDFVDELQGIDQQNKKGGDIIAMQ